ncbi:MAG: DUF1579 family protein [Dehalococcoidia bacterium]
MNAPTWLQSLAGPTWRGNSGLWMDPTQPGYTSETKATVRLVAKGIAAAIEYNWAFEGEPHEGILVVGANDDGEAHASWIDSFHMDGSFMVSKGQTGAGDSLSVLGSYAAPEGPDWGWRTEIEKLSDTAWRVRMYNIPPDSEELLGFELNLSA